jgi:hypothetical protein
MRALIGVTVAVLLTVGCATTLSELRATTPVLSTVVARPHRALALCVFDGANSLPKSGWRARAGNNAFQIVDYQPDPRIAVIGTAGTPSSANVELLFTPATDASSRIEMRLGFSDEMSRRQYERELSAVLDRCAG